MLLKKSFPILLRKYLKFKIVIVIFSISFFILFLFFNLKITEIKCTQNNQNCGQIYTNVLNKYISSSVFALNYDKIKNQLVSVMPAKNVEFYYSFPNKLTVKITVTESNTLLNLYLVDSFPQLSLNSHSVSSDSGAFFRKPTLEIREYLKQYSATSFNLWPSGELTPTSSTSAKIHYLIISKPNTDTLLSIYSELQDINNYLEFQDIFIINDTFFLSREGQPDIITSVPYERKTFLEALQSLGFLTTIKKDVKIIDLRFKNPIIR